MLTTIDSLARSVKMFAPMNASEHCEASSLGIVVERVPLPGQTAANTLACTPELLLEVFMAGYRTVPDAEYDIFCRNISSVCHLWRSVALDTSELWTRVRIPVDHDVALSGVYRLLGLSKRLPLNVHIFRGSRDNGESYELERARISAIMQLLIPHVYRWHSLHVDVKFLSSLQVVCDTCNLPVPLLDSMSLLCQEWNPEVLPVDLPGLIIPPVRNVVARTLRMGPNFSAPKPNRIRIAATTTLQNLLPAFRQARELEVVYCNARGGGVGPVVFMQNLAHYHRLASLTLRDQMLQPQLKSVDVVDEPVLLAGLVGGTRLESLEEVTISNFAPGYACYVLRDMVAPKFRHLRIIGLSPQNIRPMLKTLHARQTPLCSFNRISLDQLPFDDNLVDALTYAETCEHLRIRGFVTACFFEDMSEVYLGDAHMTDNYESWVCPRLRTLDVDSAMMDLCAIRRLVEARCSSTDCTRSPDFRERKPAALQELHITSFDVLASEDREWFEKHLKIFTWTTKLPCSPKISTPVHPSNSTSYAYI
ncbi:hypothetical protein NM688_g3156 [Phlebia brevispora]|uniref:Uncharacterized protein n=1 Tax=Phlebia brevispora TaxID=194682 RepID=A0ACC1T6R7_9APHY|nr:hypothetical protein NM688_g3156 [Phlebia brevispora]